MKITTALFRAAAVLITAGIALAQPPAATPEPRPLPNERYGVIVVSVRQNYLWPNAITVQEGFYRIVIDDSSRLAAGVSAVLEDERGAKLGDKPTNAKGGRSEFKVRLARGRHKIKVGPKNEWVLDVTVEPGR